MCRNGKGQGSQLTSGREPGTPLTNQSIDCLGPCTLGERKVIGRKPLHKVFEEGSVVTTLSS